MSLALLAERPADRGHRFPGAHSLTVRVLFKISQPRAQSLHPTYGNRIAQHHRIRQIARNQLQRCGLIYRQSFLSDGKIQTDADHNGNAIPAIRNRHHFSEYATKFLAARKNIVRPFQQNIFIERAAEIAYRTNNRLTHLATGNHLQPTIDGRIAHNRNRHAHHQRHDE